MSTRLTRPWQPCRRQPGLASRGKSQVCRFWFESLGFELNLFSFNWQQKFLSRIAASQGGTNDERRAELLHGASMIVKAKEGFSNAGDVVRYLLYISGLYYIFT